MLLELVDRARLDVPASITTEQAATAVRPYAWLLDRVGADGVKLTTAGYLPPAMVVEAMTTLGDRVSWIGKGKREDLTLPVLNLRESAQYLKPVRKSKGHLVLSPAGRRLGADPVALSSPERRCRSRPCDRSGHHHRGWIPPAAVSIGFTP